MLNSDISNELESLSKRISELEEKVKDSKSNLKMFGRSYSSIGSSSSDFIIKTKGLVKIQWANKFIDLIKDGLINVDSKFIYTVDGLDNIGNKDGLYVTSDGSVYLKSKDSIINLVGEIGTTYVSFMGVQETTSDEKYTALNNIGFMYDSLESVDENAIENGIVYILDLLKLYIIYNGALSEYQISLPNPITEQLVILKSDTSEGALVIKGTGIENSIAFDNLYIYVDDNTHFESDGSIIFNVGSSDIVTISSSDTTVNNSISSNTIKSINATVDSGFRLYFSGGESTLEVDNLIVRNSINSSNSLILYPIYWDGKNNIITDAEETSSTSYDLTLYGITLKYENEFEAGDILYVYASIEDEDTGVFNLVLFPFQVEDIEPEIDSNIIYVTLAENYIDETLLESLDTADIIDILRGQVVFLVQSSGGSITLLRKKEVNIDLIESEQIEDASSDDKVISRIGYLTDLLKTENDNGSETLIEGYGIYSNNAAFLKAGYTSDYELLIDDNSSKFASTEWVHKLFPKGTILMFNGASSEIPEGWQICDGTNDTPNLTGYFIKSGTTSGSIETIEVISGESAEEDQNIIQFLSYSLIFIMKIV